MTDPLEQVREKRDISDFESYTYSTHAVYHFRNQVGVLCEICEKKIKTYIAKLYPHLVESSSDQGWTGGGNTRRLIAEANMDRDFQDVRCDCEAKIAEIEGEGKE